MNQIKPIIGRVGGKWRISSWIIEHIERFDWSLYVEPFCGSAAIYFQLLNKGIPERIKSRGHHPRFVLNDMDSRIINLYRCCRDFPELLAYATYFTPYSREEHRNAQKGESVDDLIEMCNKLLVDGWQSFGDIIDNTWAFQTFDEKSRGGSHHTNRFNSIPSRLITASQHLGERFNELKQGIESIPDESIREQSKQALEAILGEVQKILETDIRIEFVRQFLVDGWQSFAQDTGHGWGTKRHLEYNKMLDSTNLFNIVPDRITNSSPHLQEISELKKVYLENDDFEKVCRRWDTPHTLHYLDPPYFGKEDYYSEKFTKECHLRLCQMVHELEGQVILSYYPHPDILEMYSENDWELHFKETVASSAGVTRNSKTKTRPKRTELLLIRKNKTSERKLFNLSGQMNLF
jgi:site-specific DNA-adenine methylase